MEIYKFLYLKNSELISNFGTVKTFVLHYFIMKNLQVHLEQSIVW